MKHGDKKRLKRKDIDGLLTLYAQGYTTVYLALKYNIDRTTVAHHVKKAGFAPLSLEELEYRKQWGIGHAQEMRDMRLKKKQQSIAKDKYAHLLYENINQGKSYAGYCKDQGIKMVRLSSSEDY